MWLILEMFRDLLVLAVFVAVLAFWLGRAVGLI
jgi:hypothetical protein